LLDENLPRRLRYDFSEIEAFSVRDLGWEGTKNGELLRRMREYGLDVRVTFDKNLQYQQNLGKHGIRVIVLDVPSNKYKDLRLLVGDIIDALLEPFEGVRTVP